MFQKIQETIIKYHLFSTTDRLLVAVSGGADSMILAYSLQKLGYNMAIIHCNFQLRGAESDAEEAFVRDFAEKNKLPFFCQKFDTQVIVNKTKESIQVVARNLRYTFFEEILEKEKYDFCALAHHADDQAETLLMSLIKGSSHHIWKEIPIKRGKFVRPLLHIHKAEILEMTQQIGLTFCTDSSNHKNDYTRNYIRNIIFTYLTKINLNVISSIIEKNSTYTKQQQFIQNILKKYDFTENEILFEPFVKDFGAEFLAILITDFCEKKGIFGFWIQEVCELIHSISGKYVETPLGKMVRSRQGLVFIEKEKQAIAPFEYHLQIGEKSFVWGEKTWIFSFPTETVDFSATKTGTLFYIDAAKVQFPLQVRQWQQGDKMMPLGMRNYKKISDIMIDKKFSVLRKIQAFVVADASGEIIALSDFRVSEKVKIENDSAQILTIKLSKKYIKD